MLLAMRFVLPPSPFLYSQERMLDDLGNRIDATQEKLVNVNVRMKETLKKVGH